MLQNGHYEIDYRSAGMDMVRYVYRPRELPSAINSILAAHGAVINQIREVEE